MKQRGKIQKAWWAALLLSLFVLAVPTVAQAADGEFDTPKQAFTWYMKGQGCQHLKILALEHSANRTLDYATFYVKDSKGVRTDILYFHESDSHDKKEKYVDSEVCNKLPDTSIFYLTNDANVKPLYYIRNDKNIIRHTRNTNSENCYAEFDWYYPTSFAGQTMTLCVDGQINDRNGHLTEYKKEIGKIEFDEITFEAFDAFPSTDKGEEGMLKIPFMSDRVINSVQVSYKDALNSLKTLDRVTLDKGAYSGFVTVPATDVHKELTITANVVSGKPNDGDVTNSDWPKQLTGDIMVTIDKAPMIHDPRLLTAELKNDSLLNPRVLLKWQIADTAYADALDGDMFLVQRSLTGRIEDFQDLGSVEFDLKQKNYEFSDDKFVSQLTPELIDRELGIPIVRYRVVRASTKELWGMERNPTASYLLPRLKTLELLKPINVKAEWADEENRTVNVTWDYDDSEYYHEHRSDNRDCIHIWDERAEMRVVTRMYNRDGQLVDSLNREVSTEERRTGHIEMTLGRSCVNYDIQIIVNSKSSPIGHATGELLVKIKGQDDWNEFARRVNGGETRLNAILMPKENITITSASQMVGTEKNPYQGIFLGSNIIVYMEYTTTSDEYAAPFRFVADGATISNLITSPHIVTSKKFASGIVGKIVGGTAYLESCEVQMFLSSRVNGDGTHGGLVACMDRDESLYASNCFVQGVFYGENTVNCGGLVGWRRKTAFVLVDRCYFAPSSVTLDPEGSYTLVRTNATADVGTVIRDCSYNKPFGKVQGTQASAVPKEWNWTGGYPTWGYYAFPPTPSHFEYTAELPGNKFYYENNGKILPSSLRVTPLRSSALLTWSTDEKPVDYFEVWRKQDGESDFKPIATQIIDTQFEDKTTSPVHTYEYYVLSANDCEGKSTVESDVVTGGCEQWGTLEGYVQFPDGTGIPNIPVNITQDYDGGESYQAKTDANGHFSISNLPYWGSSKRGDYRVAPDLSGYTGIQPVSFGTQPGSNYVNNVRFEVTDNVSFSGYVQYNGTSIPVQGVRFLVDGIEVRNAAGPIESDHEGRFSFRILPTKHDIQAVKDGHKFLDNGWYYADEQDKTEKRHNFTTDKAGIYFYDDTRVTLIGRVAGGKDQGELPLGNSLSRNNLGDDLQMVFTLEGDNVSRLVWDIQDRTKKTYDSVYVHKAHDTKYKYQTAVHVTEHRLVVKPDVHTGEYMVKLPPVKWKIQQITAKGYPTLFQDGTINDVIDLTDSLTEHHNVCKGDWKDANGDPVREVTEVYYAKYNRIYHSPVIIDYKQIGYDTFDYFGNRYYTAKDLSGDSEKVPLAYPVEKKKSANGKEVTYEAAYVFGHPVFSVERKYPLKISAIEKYYYNNDINNDTLDIVRLSGGVVTVQNGFKSTTHREEVELDKMGEATYNLEVAQIPYALQGDAALRTLNMTLLMDGTHYEAEPLKAYIMNIYAKPGAKEILTNSRPVLFDILRDPPGGNSSAKLSKGTTLKSAFALDLKTKTGFALDLGFGTSWDTWAGVGAGVWNRGNTAFDLDLTLTWDTNAQTAYSYTMTANSDISTSSGITMVGADADVYIGMETNLIMKPSIAIRAITDDMYQRLRGEEKAGRLTVIAKSQDPDTHKDLYLVRSETMGVGQQVTSTFAHSQKYIVDQLIPHLQAQCEALMFTGSKADAQKQADATGKPVYLSLRLPSDPQFGVVNAKKVVNMGDEAWNYVYNTTDDTAREGLNYMIVLPSDWDKTDKEDKVADFCQSMLYWALLVAQNEAEKLNATTLMRNFDVDGGPSMTYSEEFSSQYDTSISNVDITTCSKYGGFLGGADKVGTILFNSLANTTIKFFEGKLAETIAKSIQGDHKKQNGAIETVGFKWHFSLLPVLSIDITPKYSSEQKYSRKESFTISMKNKNHLDFDVYYAEAPAVTDMVKGWNEVFSNYKYDLADNNVRKQIFSELSELTNNTKSKRGFIYRTRGGATCHPYEGERTTKFYNTGAVLDERTKRIENPKIRLDKQSVSGVPYGEPARFKIYMTNESEQPEAISGDLEYLGLYLEETSNPNGAKLMVDGMPLSGGNRTIHVLPGQVTEKTLEVSAGEGFDYEDIRIGLISLVDLATYSEASLSVHFLQGAGPVEISMPGDKWIMNTDAAYDKERGWHMPVVISGFDKNQKNFDHIEFQYKESTRGDDYWTNLCAFYADSTYYRPASGTKAMIPENGNIITDFFGEGVVIEKAYDLRAVLFCRNGNGYLTSTSKVLSGVKDTRCPQLFGTPEPKDGILGYGDNVVFNFSEPIEHNYLRETTNFEVKGETNETAIQEEPSLQFNGKGYAQSEARRNFADKSVTVEVMIKPDKTNSEMPIFSHGTDGKLMQLWLTKERWLKAVVDDQTLTLEKEIDTDGFVQVAMAIDNEKKRLTLFADTLSCSLDSVIYSGYGPIIFGSTNQPDVSKRKFFKGRMLQGRIWNRAMDKTLLNYYGNKMLTGYEMGLTDYYPMNEGRGKYAMDEAQGAHLTLNGASWSQPRGMSLRLSWDEERPVKGMKLKPAFFSRTSEQDYTLMFWFQTEKDGRGALLSNGSGRKTDMSPEEKFFIGFEADTLKYRSNGMEFKLGNTFSDDAWHHFAMTVNRAHQVANIYVDNVLKAQFTTENLGGMSGDDFYLGNMVWHEQGLNNDVLHQYNAMSGHIDGICLFEQALPTSLIKRYSTKTIGGSETGLITYLNFDRQERQKNGDLVLRPYTQSQKIHYDLDGKETEKRDTVFIDTDDYVRQHIDQNIGAPLQAYEELRNLNFSYVGRNNQLLVNIDELDSRINKRTVYVTVCDIPDLNGNYMASPATVAVYVDRNPLRWEYKTYKTTLWYDGYDFNLSTTIVNNSGAPHTYTVENLPKWLSVDRVSDVIEPKSEQWLMFTINKDINVGTYDHVIYLTDENGLSEPMMLNITVEGKDPYWDVASDLKQYSMSVIGRVQIGDDIVTDSRDKVGVFDAMGNCLGCSNVNYDPLSAEALAYVTVYSDNPQNKNELIFKLWHYATGKVMVLQPSQTVAFSPNGTAGTIKSPIVLKAGNLYIQELELEKGWNWVSFNVYNSYFRDGVNELLGRFQWKEGDILVDETNSLMLVYKNNEWLRNMTPEGVKLDSVPANTRLSVAHSYRIKVANSVNVELTGTTLKQPSERAITVKKGWNYIGYTPMVNLTVATALADYFDLAEDGDVVKSKTEFAMFTKGANNSAEWKGNLKYMKPGEGYMLFHQRDTTATFKYPFYEATATILENAASREPEAESRGYANNMSLAAITDGISLQEGDRLLALSEAEVRGEALVGDSVVYMTISGDRKAPLSFAIERNGEIVATTGDVLIYENNAVIGSPDEPTRINFAPTTQQPREGWFTLQGVRLQSRPTKSGVYIYNGHKQIIK